MKKFICKYKYALIVPILILGALCMSSCSSQERSVTLAGMALVSEIRSAEFTIESGEVIQVLRSVELPEEDVALLESALDDYILARDNLSALKEQWPNVPTVLYGLGAEYERLKRAYEKVYYVAEVSWPLYEKEAKELLSRWRKEVYALEQSYLIFKEALDAPPEPLSKTDLLKGMLEIAYMMSLGE